jgi:hypothetical protein
MLTTSIRTRSQSTAEILNFNQVNLINEGVGIGRQADGHAENGNLQNNTWIFYIL